ADSTNASPCSLSDKRPQLVELESVTEEVSVRRCVMVRDADHRSVEDICWNCAALEVARGIHCCEDATQPFKDQLIHKSAAVVSDINDEALFANLRKVLLYKLIKPRSAHIRQIDITNLASGPGVNFLAVGGDHV